MTLIAAPTSRCAPRDGFKRSYDKVANRVSFYINSVARTMVTENRREEEREREREKVEIV